MRYDFTGVVKGGLVMLLANLKICRIGERGGVGGEVGNAVGRNMREGFDDVIDREAISAQNIGFRGVVNREVDEIDEVGKTDA